MAAPAKGKPLPEIESQHRAASRPSVDSLQSSRRWSSASALLLGILVASVLVQLSGGAQVLLQFDRSAIAGGQWWRILTGNFVHYGWLHWAANVGVFAALYWIAQGRSRWTAAVLIPFAIAVGAAVYRGASEVMTYRGISGVDCALLAWVLITMAVQDRGWAAAGWIGALSVVAGKSVYEAATGHVLLPTSAPAGVEVVGVTHVIGLAAGTLAALIAHGFGRVGTVTASLAPSRRSWTHRVPCPAAGSSPSVGRPGRRAD